MVFIFKKTFTNNVSIFGVLWILPSDFLIRLELGGGHGRLLDRGVVKLSKML